MTEERALERFGLQFNPFPPATTGVAVIQDVWVPDSWDAALRARYQELAASAGDKAMAIIGEYGSGKTYVLHWLADKVLRPAGVQAFSFDNPGLAFYDLANRLLRRVGRYELAKGLWELLSARMPDIAGQLLLPQSFSDWLAWVKDPRVRYQILPRLADALRQEGLTDDEEIAHRTARIIVETGDRPYFEYRDFVAGRTGSLVAEREEAAYFRTLIRILDKVYGGNAVAFLIDEFEDVALQRRLNRKQAFEYMATLRRLLDATREERFLLVVSMTPEAYDQTVSIDPSLDQRFVHPWRIPELTEDEAYTLMRHRLERARTQRRDDLWPFADDALAKLQPITVSRPRRLIKVCWQALATTVEAGPDPPISADMVAQAEQTVYPASFAGSV